MKDSKVDWLGKIPYDWEIGNIGQLYIERSEKVSDVDFPPLSVTMKGIVPQLSTAAKTDAHDDRKLVRKGDFAINSRSDRRGSCGISSYDGSVSLINTILTPREEMHPVYYNWLFHSTMFSDEFYKWGHGIVNDLWTTNWQDMKKISVPIPSYEEQELIADFLDAECARIDSVIEKTRASIEEYKKLKQAIITQAVTKGIRPNRKMKSNQDRWTSFIPDNWECKKFKYIATVKSNLVSPDDYADYPQVSPESIEKGTGQLLPCKTVAEVGVISGNHLFFEGQILYSKIRPKLNKVAIAPFNGLCSADMYPIETVLNKKFFVYALLSDTFLANIGLITEDRVKMPKINQEELASIQFAVPPEEEQYEIVEYLDKQCTNIDRLIFLKKNTVMELESYKKSLIYEYVTGKKGVRIVK